MSKELETEPVTAQELRLQQKVRALEGTIAALRVASSNRTAGVGVVERVGWEIGENGDARFTALIVFADGPPKLPFDVIWERTPVRIVMAGVTNG